MLHVLEPLVPVAAHTLAIYTFLLVAFRCFHRQLGQLNVIDLVIVVVLGSAVETSMVNGNTTLLAGIVSAGTLFLANAALGQILLRSRHLNHLVSAGPYLLVHDGKFIDEHLKRAGLTHNDVLEALREHEQADIKRVKYAVLEVDGAINVVPFSNHNGASA